MSIEIRREGEIEFSKPLARALFRDSRLSFSARGLFAFLWDLPADWLIRSTWLATRGPDGKDAIRARLAELRAVGAMRIEPIREADGKVAGTRWVLISPEKWAKAAPLSHSTESGNSRLSAFPTVGEPAAKVLQGVKVLQDEAAARAPARSAADAAATPQRKQDQGRRRRGDETIHHGVEVWTPADAEGLQSLIDRHGAERIKEVAGSLTPAAGHRAPYLSAVVAAFQALASAEVQAAAEAIRQARLAASPPIDPEARERGLHLLPAKLRDRVANRVTSMESEQ
ncbi:MAG: hypothetical protein BroJett001_31730 [Chloroflexota bacterium]|nr:MAG: hypothetical protein BroJett001_31730 [Chloroflexota bacterium]